jgi:hypothetical protein
MKTGNGKTGRPVSFDKDAAIEAAMLIFGEQALRVLRCRSCPGDGPQSLKHLCGVRRQTGCVCVGGQSAIWRIEHNMPRGRSGSRPQKGVIRALFENTVEFLTTPGHPPTCVSLAGAMGCSLSATPAEELMTEIRKQNEAAVKSRLVRARKSGELPKEVNVDDYTRYLSTILAGLSIQAVNGSTKAELKRTAEMAIKHLGC